MTQSELIDLIGLKSTEEKLKDFFDKNNLGKPPKTINANQDCKIIVRKSLNLSFSFCYNIINDNFQPPICTKNDNYTFEAILSEINFLPKPVSAKNPDPKPDDFWDIGPKLNASLELIEQSLTNIEFESERFIFFEKDLGHEKMLILKFNKKDQHISESWAKIKESKRNDV